MYPTSLFLIQKVDREFASERMVARGLLAFTQLADLDFDKDGNLLALQYADEAAWKGE